MFKFLFQLAFQGYISDQDPDPDLDLQDRVIFLSKYLNPDPLNSMKDPKRQKAYYIFQHMCRNDLI